MKTKAVRLYGEMDLRLEEFELPEIADDEILAHVISDSICMSSYKAAKQGKNHKRVPDNVSENPVIIGHEFCGELVKVGSKWKDKYKEGDRFVIQPAINYKGSLAAPGYSYKYIGGAATYVIIPQEFMEMDCLLPYKGDAFFLGSLAEPMSCIVGGFHANYHTTAGVYEHMMGCRKNSKMAILAGAGPMGMGAIDYAINGGNPPSLLVVTDIDDARLSRASSLLTVEAAKANGVDLRYINTNRISDYTSEYTDAVEYLKSLAGGDGFDDVFVYAPVKPVVEMGDALLGRDGCLNFFAGPTKTDFSAMFNFYNVHYASTHIVGTSGGNTDDMKESISLMESGKINPSSMITHIGGLDSAIETTLHLPEIPGAKKLIYTGISFPLTAISDLEQLANQEGELSDIYKNLAELVKKTDGLWNVEAEKYLLSHAKAI